MNLDIDAEDLEIVKTILAKYASGYEVWAFGSRVAQRARKFSDLDIAIITAEPLDLITYANLQMAFSESNLPFKVDIVDWSTTAGAFKEIIQQHYNVLQQPSIKI